MGTSRQSLGERGEKAVCDHVLCPPRHLTRLRGNFQCADVICKFCGYLAQVKATKLPPSGELPKRIMGAAWAPQQDQITAGIYHGLFIAGYAADEKTLIRIDYVPAHILQVTPEVFEPRNPLSPTAKRAGWKASITTLTRCLASASAASIQSEGALARSRSLATRDDRWRGETCCGLREREQRTGAGTTASRRSGGVAGVAEDQPWHVTHDQAPARDPPVVARRVGRRSPPPIARPAALRPPLSLEKSVERCGRLFGDPSGPAQRVHIDSVDIRMKLQALSGLAFDIPSYVLGDLEIKL